MSVGTRRLPSDQDASGRTLGREELELLRQAIESGTLTSTKGTFVKQLETRFAAFVKSKHAIACTSGSGAVHLAVAAIDPEPGDEIITTSITDMGALTPIMYQGAIPVFADVDPHTYNVTAETIAARITDRTRAIIVTHLFGNPCDMTAIMALANAKKIPVIEDCAQAYGATHKGQHVGTFGAVGCFSLQQGKHITTGEGGLCVTNDDALARRIFLLVNKAWGYGDAKPDHYFIALNYRMNELTGAVAAAQLEKLPDVVKTCVANANALTAMLEGIPGLETPKPLPGDVCTFWKYSPGIDGSVIPGSSPAVAKALKDYDVASAPRYIQKPAFECQIFKEQRTFGKSRWPFTLARPEAVDYSRERFPGTYAALERVLVLPWNSRYVKEDVEHVGRALREAVETAKKGGKP